MSTRPSRRPRTLRGTLTHTLARNLAAAAVVVSAWTVGTGLGGTVIAGQTGLAPDPGLDRAARLIEQHDCWTSDAPVDTPMPTHAVVTLPGGRARMMSADVGFGIWRYHEPGVVHAFCA